MNQDVITIRVGPADAKWHAEHTRHECAHFHPVAMDEVLLWSNVPYLGPWCRKCDPEVARIDLQNSARASGARVAEEAMPQVKAYFGAERG